MKQPDFYFNPPTEKQLFMRQVVLSCLKEGANAESALKEAVAFSKELNIDSNQFVQYCEEVVEIILEKLKKRP